MRIMKQNQGFYSMNGFKLHNGMTNIQAILATADNIVSEGGKCERLGGKQVLRDGRTFYIFTDKVKCQEAFDAVTNGKARCHVPGDDTYVIELMVPNAPWLPYEPCL